VATVVSDGCLRRHLVGLVHLVFLRRRAAGEERVSRLIQESNIENTKILMD
jgi:hypothetical protein